MKKLWVCLLALALLTGCLCTSAGASSLIDQPFVTRDMFDSQEALDEFNQTLLDKEAAATAYYTEKNAPVTLENGVQVQRVPNDFLNYNLSILEADKRGCFACHTEGLEKVLTSATMSHPVMRGSYDAPWTVETCIICHDDFAQYDFTIRDVMHSVHMMSPAFNAIGTCLSCHYITAEGDYELWDRVKYSELHGITTISADANAATLTYDQNVITPLEEMYYHLSSSIYPTARTPYSDADREVFENWTVKVIGEVENPVTMTLPEMIEEFGSVTRIQTNACSVSGMGDAMVANAEVTGIPLRALFEKAQVKPTGTMVVTIADEKLPFNYDGYKWGFGFQELLGLEPLLVYEINGEMIPAEQGYPCQLWAFGCGAGNFTKRISEFYIYEDDPANSGLGYGTLNMYELSQGNTVYSAKPAMAFVKVEDGQVFAQGEDIVLEGFAFAYDQPVVSIEFSMDRGETWKTFELENTTNERWVYFTYTIPAPEAGSYVVQAKSTDAAGTVCVKPIQLLVNVQ